MCERATLLRYSALDQAAIGVVTVEAFESGSLFAKGAPRHRANVARMLCRRLISLITVAVLLAGCSSAGGVAPVATMPLSASAARHGATSRLVLRIRVPKKQRPRGVRYVSPSTQSMTVDVIGTGVTPSPSGYPRTIDLTPTSNGCATESSGTLCTLTLLFSAGTYAATIATYDQTGGGGHLLSRAQTVPFTVHTGKANAISLSLGGVPASIVATPLAPGYLIGGASGLTLYGASAQPLIVETLDADGNVISGGGAPTIAVTSSTPSIATVSGGGASTPNLFELQAASNPVKPGTLTLNVTATPLAGSGGSTITASVAVRVQHSVVYVSACGSFCLGASGPDAVFVFYDGNIATPNLTITSGVEVPYGMTVDAYGTLYVANLTGNDVTEYSPGSTAVSATITNGIDDPTGVAVNSTGTLFVTNYAGGTSGTITEYAPHSTTASATLSNSLELPNGLTFDASDTLYVANNTNGTVTEYLSSNYGSLSKVLTGADEPAAVALDANGTVYVADGSGSVALNEYAAGASTPSSTLSFPDSSNAEGVAVDAAGAIYAVDVNADKVFEYSPGSTGTVAPSVTIPASSFSGRKPYFIAVVPAAVAP